MKLHTLFIDAENSEHLNSIFTSTEELHSALRGIIERHLDNLDDPDEKERSVIDEVNALLNEGHVAEAWEIFVDDLKPNDDYYYLDEHEIDAISSQEHDRIVSALEEKLEDAKMDRIPDC
jgi:hypothetical protein